MAVRSGTWPRHAPSYRQPQLLSDIRLLDLLELSGSTRQASRLLQISQPSVSRRYRALAEDFELQATPRASHAIRFGSNATMRLLRLSCRCHRLQGGVARLGADLLHHGLLHGLPWLLPVPPRFRPLRHWLELVAHGVLDGALVSQLELDMVEPDAAAEVELHRLGQLPLAVALEPGSPPTASRSAIPVLVPAQTIAPGLRTLLRRQGCSLREVGTGCVTPRQWREQLRRSGSAIPVADGLGAADGWDDALLQMALAEDAISPVWLALPRGGGSDPLLQHTLMQLRAHPALGA